MFVRVIILLGLHIFINHIMYIYWESWQECSGATAAGRLQWLARSNFLSLKSGVVVKMLGCIAMQCAYLQMLHCRLPINPAGYLLGLDVWIRLWITEPLALEMKLIHGVSVRAECQSDAELLRAKHNAKITTFILHRNGCIPCINISLRLCYLTSICIHIPSHHIHFDFGIHSK